MNNNESKSGIFELSFQDVPLILEWVRIEGQSPSLNQNLSAVADLLADTYSRQELQFARMHPEAIAQDYFLKPLAPLSTDGPTDWALIQEQIDTIFHQFFKTTNFSQFTVPGEIQYLLTAKNKNTGAIVGFIQFLVHPDFPAGTVKAGMFGIAPIMQDKGFEKVLISLIFKLMPVTTKLVVHTRITNEKLLADYASWGFVHMPDGYWVNSEYLAVDSDVLQKVANSLIEIPA